MKILISDTQYSNLLKFKNKNLIHNICNEDMEIKRVPEKHIQRVNKVIKDMVFDYHGPILSDTMMINLQYQFIITGQRKMISVGEYYNYLIVSVEVIGGDETATTIFAVFNSINGNLLKEYRFINGLQRDISDELQYFFGSDHVRVHFNDDSIKFSNEYADEISNFKK